MKNCLIFEDDCVFEQNFIEKMEVCVEELKQIELKWIAGRNSLSHKVYFGKTNPPEFKTGQSSNVCKIEKVDQNSKYFWRIDEVTEEGIVKGDTWSFTTNVNKYYIKEKK